MWSGNKAPEQETEATVMLAQWVEDELERFATDQLENIQAVDLRPSYNQPTRPREAMIAYADGTKWDPGFGAGPYWRSSAGLWVPFGWKAAGQLQFPATQVPSADANTLDDYEEGTWTPNFTFVTPGNLTKVFSFQQGFYTKIGRMVNFSFGLVTSTFTHTTASGNLSITGLPFATLNNSNYRSYTSLLFQGVTKANYTQLIGTHLGNSTELLVQASGSAQTVVTLTPADTPTGGTLVLAGTGTYAV